MAQGLYQSFSAQTARIGGQAENAAAEFLSFVSDSEVIRHRLQIAVFVESYVDDYYKFHRLVVEWKTERGAMSSVTEGALCPSYQGIIGMGAVAVPLILAQLRSEGDDPDQWFWALQAITGEDPVNDEDRGNYPRMAAAWLAWADRREYGW